MKIVSRDRALRQDTVRCPKDPTDQADVLHHHPYPPYPQQPFFFRNQSHMDIAEAEILFLPLLNIPEEVPFRERRCFLLSSYRRGDPASRRPIKYRRSTPE